jgi:DNA topoisomerase-1
MKLMLVESPNKIKKIEAILGEGWKVMASVGHIRDLPKKELGVDLSSFDLKYEYIPSVTLQDRVFPSGEDRVLRIKKETKNATKIYLATDLDREGEAIAWHLKETLNLKESDYERVTFNEITSEAILDSLKKARKIDNALVHAQEARRALDRMVGYLVSPKLSESTGLYLSAGRVQSPAVRLAVEKEKQIRAFKKLSHFGAALFFDENTWEARWDTTTFVTEENPYVLEEALAQKAADCRELKVIDSKNIEEREAPPSAFSTSLLLQAASVTLKLDPEITAKLAQKLFEQGSITYIRTDSVNISEEAAAQIRDYAKNKGWKIPETIRQFKAKRNAQEAHEAIRPTDIIMEVAGEDEPQQKLYDLIRKRTIASQLSDAHYAVNTVMLASFDGDKTYQFKAKGRKLIDPGWRVITASDTTSEEDEEKTFDQIPLLSIGSVIKAESGKVKILETKPPKRYTKASLIAKLEKEGIGRPSTYSAIMQTILNKGYLKESKRMLEPTETGMALVEQLISAEFSFMDLKFTKQLEEDLDDIADSKKTYLDVVTSAYENLERDIKKSAVSGTLKPKFPCPVCQGALRKCMTATKSVFWACRTPNCKTYLDDKDGKPASRPTYPCPECRAPLRRYKRKTEQGYLWACPEDDCNTFLDDKEGVPIEKEYIPCMKCGHPMYRRKGDRGYWWGCSGYKHGCKNAMDDEKGKAFLKKYKKGA